MALGNCNIPRAQGPVVLACLFALAACVPPPPSGPAVLALPPEGKNLLQFQQEDIACRGYAQQQLGNGASQPVMKESAISSASVGVAVGAATGAAIGAAAGSPGPGAAAGAGAGLLAGSAVGFNNEAASAAGLQRRYDFAYAQCMAASGNQVQPPPLASLYEPYAYPYSADYDPWFDPWAGFGFFGFIEPTHHHHPHAFFDHAFHHHAFHDHGFHRG